MNIVSISPLVSFIASCILIVMIQGQAPDQVPEITSNATTVDVTDDDIAHFTCSARGQPTPSISWLRFGDKVTNSVKGVKILSLNDSSRLVISHLFVAITDSDQRGDYVCVASNEHGQTEMTFVITAGHSHEQETSLNHIAIGLSVSLSVLVFGAIAFFIVRAQWRLRTKTGETAHTNDVVTNCAVPRNHVQANPPSEESLQTTEETPMIQTSCV